MSAFHSTFTDSVCPGQQYRLTAGDAASASVHSHPLVHFPVY